MCYKTTKLVLNHFPGPIPEKLTLAVLADYVFAKGDGTCYPSYQSIADMLGCSKRTAMRHVAKLVETGYVEVVHTGGMILNKDTGAWIKAGNVYRINTEKLDALPNIKERWELSTEPVENPVDNLPTGDTADTGTGDTADTRTKHNTGDTADTLIEKENKNRVIKSSEIVENTKVYRMTDAKRFKRLSSVLASSMQM